MPDVEKDADIVTTWRQAVHESYCGTPPSCGLRRGCEGLPGQRETDILRKVLRWAGRVTSPVDGHDSEADR